jgi:cytochrome c-type biogenesis protein CcmH
MTRLRAVIYGMLILLILMMSTASVLAQQVSDDAVNDVAEHMFCPVCENEPLDDCRTSTCIQWKEEIRDQLADGRTEEQIRQDFVSRYGQHVLAVPSDPVLRFLSFVVPVLATIAAVAAGWFALQRWQAHRPMPEDVSRHTPPNPPNPSSDNPDNDTNEDDPYRRLLERDVD